MRKRGGFSIDSKRAISPLVATMFLIIFAISLGAIVMLAGTKYYEEEYCKGLVLEINKIDGKSQICYGSVDNEGYINFMLKNSGNVDIDNLQLSFVGEKSIFTTSLSDFPPNKKSIIDKMDKTTRYNQNIGQIKDITFTPYIRIEDSIKKCSMNEFSITDIKPCSE